MGWRHLHERREHGHDDVLSSRGEGKLTLAGKKDSGGSGGVELVPPSPSAEAGPSRLPADLVASGSRRVSFPDDLLSSCAKTKKGKGKKGKARAEDCESDGEGELGKGASISCICQIWFSDLVCAFALS